MVKQGKTICGKVVSKFENRRIYSEMDTDWICSKNSRFEVVKYTCIRKIESRDFALCRNLCFLLNIIVAVFEMIQQALGKQYHIFLRL